MFLLGYVFRVVKHHANQFFYIQLNEKPKSDRFQSKGVALRVYRGYSSSGSLCINEWKENSETANKICGLL